MTDMIKSVKQIFADQVFFVPDYQRGYAWEDQQCQDLLDDLELLPETGRHYTGTLVLSERAKAEQTLTDANMQEYMAFDIIDGQQRLTTIVILLKTIYDEMKTMPEFQALAANLCQTYLHNIDQNGQPFTKLTLNADSQDFFANNILTLRPGISGPAIRSHQRLLEAKSKFALYLAEKRQIMGGDYPAWLQSFYGKVINQLRLIFYPVSDELDAGVIFETMNDRGKPLTELEKVKNHLLYLSAKLILPSAHNLRERVNTTWKFIYESLMTANLSGRANEDQLLRAHWLMAYIYDLSQWNNARSIKDHFNLKVYQGKHPELLQDLLNYLDSLQNAASAYCDIYAPSRPNAFNNITDHDLRNQIIIWSKKLQRQGVRAAYLPALIALRLKVNNDDQAYYKVLQLFEKFSFRVFYILHLRSNAGQSALFRLGYMFYQTPNVVWLLEEIGQLLILYSPKEKYERAFDNVKENWYEWSGINYFLYEYEHHLAGGRPVELTWESISSRPRSSSVEHILPQTPTDPAWTDRFSNEQRQFWTHQYANLTLTYDNSSLGNRKFSDKKGSPGQKGTYSNSPLFVEKEIAAYADWNEASLLERRDKLKTWALERWQVGIEPRQVQERKTVEAVIAYADEFELGEALEAIHKVLLRLKMWPTIRTGMQYRSPHNYRLSTMTIYVEAQGLAIYFHPANFTTFPGMTEDEARDLIGLKSGYNMVRREDVPDLLAGLESFEKRAKEEVSS